MKSKSPSLYRCQIAAHGLLFGFALFACGSISAQNLLQNPGFESPIDPVGSSGTTNWTIAYAYGGPGDLSIADRSTFARHSGEFGGHLRSVHDGLYHAYFTQTVTNLTPGTSYTASGYMKYWEYSFELNDKFDVYFDTIGGQGTNSSPSVTAIDDPNTKALTTYHLYSVTNTADANGKIEVRLHLIRKGNIVCCDKLYYVNGMWDDMSLTLTP